MKILIQLNHPAHYHLFSNPIKEFRKRNHTVLITIKEKDVLSKLLEGEKYLNIAPKYRKSNKLSILLNLIRSELKLYKIIKNFKPNVMLGTSPEIVHTGCLLNIPSIFFGEDDAKEVLMGTSIIYPFASVIVSPKSVDNWIWNKKTIFYEGYHELAYLNPKYFRPDKNKIKNIIDVSKPYFILRFSNLSAWHDRGKKGLSEEVAKEIIRMLKPFGNIYITSEKKIPKELEKYQIQIDPIDIHHALYYANMFIGDSQTMTIEAGILGTPSLRFNDFVGRLGCMEELEHEYGLTIGIKSKEPERLFKSIDELLNIEDLKGEWRKKTNRLFFENIDLTQLIVWLVENYPESIEILKRNDDNERTFEIHPTNWIEEI
ncbi:MAG: DUF354 domain-containing protein [Bacteroidetes bacterium]|nr:DUF354 domain-containing protein [Bacteroidota bacterium]